MAEGQANIEVNEPGSARVKKLLKVLCYLPIVLLGIGGSVIVIDMWHTAGVGRNKGTSTKSEGGFDPNLGLNTNVKRSPESPATRPTP